METIFFISLTFWSHGQTDDLEKIFQVLEIRGLITFFLVFAAF